MNRYVERVRRDEHGFTLIELLIVIVILGILAGIVVFAVGGISNKGVEAACKTDLRTVETAVEAYRAQQGSYPANLAPVLTDTTQFLRPDPDFGTEPSLVLTRSRYTIEYDGPGTGIIGVNGVDPTVACPTS